MNRRRALAAVPIALLPVACGAPRADLKLLDLTLERYASTVRWGRVEQLLPYLDPARLNAEPPSSFELERWRQLRVAGYRAEPPRLEGRDTAIVVAELELVNVNTQQARVVRDTQRWRYDTSARRWWLVSGLPSIE